MLTEAMEKKCLEIARYYGFDAQTNQLIEECAELIQQAAKCYDKGIPYSDDMIEEIADVLVMIKQFETVMSQPDRDLLDKIITEKLERQLERIANETQ